MIGRRQVVASGIFAWLGGLLGAAAGRAKQPETANTNTNAASGEAAMIDIDDPRYAQYSQARRVYWSEIGPVDDDVIAYLVSPQFGGAPAWPTTRQSYLLVRPESTLIIASDGLSDLFAGTNMQDPGFGCEVYIETDDLTDADFEAVRSSWQFDLIEMFAQNVANMGGINGALDDYGVLSMELSAPENMPAKWQTERGTVGALLNLTPPNRDAVCTLDESAVIRMISLVIITPDETEYAVAGGAKARQDLADKLLASGAGVVSSLDRTSVLA